MGLIVYIALNQIAPGQGHHLYDMSIYTSIQCAKVSISTSGNCFSANLGSGAQYTNGILILYGPLSFVAKLSVLLQLQQIFVASRRQRVFFIIQALIWSSLVFNLGYTFMTIFECVPRHKLWDPTVPGKCISFNVLLILPATVNLVFDLLLAVLPIYLVLQMQMTLKKKLAIVAIFSSGFLCAPFTFP